MTNALTRAWIWLLALSLGSTVIASLVGTDRLEGPALPLAGAAILVLSWAKARIILDRYLGLAQAPFWHRGFSTVLGLYALGLLALYLIG